MAKTDKLQDDKPAAKKYSVMVPFYLGVKHCEPGSEVELNQSQADRLGGSVSLSPAPTASFGSVL